jgi:hypothetical protein
MASRKHKIPIFSSLSIMLTGCSNPTPNEKSGDSGVSNPSIVGKWECYEKDGVFLPLVYSDEQIDDFTENPDIVGIQKLISMTIEENYEGSLTSYFLYDYFDGSNDVLEASLPLTVEGSFPIFLITSIEGHGAQEEILFNCHLSVSEIIGCTYSVGGISPDNATINFLLNKE